MSISLISTVAAEQRRNLLSGVPVSLTECAESSGGYVTSKNLLGFSGYTHILNSFGSPGSTVVGSNEDVPEPISGSTTGTVQIFGIFTNATEGVFYEQGGTGRGFTCYSHISGATTTIYGHAGDGGTTGGTAGTRVQYTVPSKTTIYEVVYTAKTQSGGPSAARLYINGTLVDSDSDAGGATDLAGGNTAGFGDYYGDSIAANYINDPARYPITGGTLHGGNVWNVSLV